MVQRKPDVYDPVKLREGMEFCVCNRLFPPEPPEAPCAALRAQVLNIPAPRPGRTSE